jgi:hypothetical protein
MLWAKTLTLQGPRGSERELGLHPEAEEQSLKTADAGAPGPDVHLKGEL